MHTHALIAEDARIARKVHSVTLSGTTLTLPEIISVARQGASVTFTPDKKIRARIAECYDQMMRQVRDGVPIYGCNTGYGARAEVVVNQGTASQRLVQAQAISESIIHTDVTVGPPLSDDVVRAAMLIRMNMLFQGVSAVRLSDLEIYRKMLNSNVTPVVGSFGGLGASGDLAHNARVLSAARQIPGTMVRDSHGKVYPAKALLKKLHIPELVLAPKAGLGLVNGDNFSTAAASLIAADVVTATLIEDVLGAMVVEVLKGSDRSFHPFLAEVRPHGGQRELSALYRYLLSGSKLAYQEMKGHVVRPSGVKVQDAYSLRCISQAEGINREQLLGIIKTIEINANSVSDNPLWVTPQHVTPGEAPWQWVSGGNFLAQHMGESIDMMRKIITRYIKRNDRHLHRMVSPHENNGLPANLSDPAAISSCAFKGMQLQSGMFEVYAMTLSQPVTTLFGIHEEANQDITVHSLTSAIMAWQNLEVLRYSMAMNLLAVAQAVDLRGGPGLLSPKTRPVYEFVRAHSAYVRKERPLHGDIQKLADQIAAGELATLIRSKVLRGIS
jgi:phenylalanine ammonia-lyase